MKTFRIAGLVTLVVTTALLATAGSAASAPVRRAGYWLEAGDGGIFAFGGAPFFGSTTEQCTLECFGFGATGDGDGYRVVDSYPATNPAVTNLYGYLTLS